MDTNKFKEMVVEELDTSYVIKIVDEFGNIFNTLCEKNDVGIKQVSDFILMFTKKGMINGFLKTIPLIHMVHEDNYSDILFNNGNKRIRLKIYNPKFRNVFNAILDNYFEQRDLFFKNSDINDIRLFAMHCGSTYIESNNSLNVTLCTDVGMNVCNIDRKFIINLLEYRCANKKIDLVLIDENVGKEKYYILSCNGFKVTFPQEYTYSFITSFVNNHNKNVSRKRKK